MAANDTNITTPINFQELVGDSWYNIIKWILFVLTLTAALYGVISWCNIKKFRNFRNYVLLSAVIVKMLSILFYHLTVLHLVESIQYPEVFVAGVLSANILFYFTVSFHCWLLVMCHIFYVDFVRVFSLDIHRRYLKSSLFAWGLPFISNLIVFVSRSFLYDYYSREIRSQILIALAYSILLLPVAISFVIYITVLYCLCCVSELGVSVTIDKCYIATIIFVFSNSWLLLQFHYIFYGHILVIAVISELGDYLNTMALAVYLIIVKSNRKLWGGFLNNRSKRVTSKLSTQVSNSSVH